MTSTSASDSRDDGVLPPFPSEQERAVIHPDGRVEWWYLGECQDDGEGGRMAADEYVPLSPVAIPALVLATWTTSRAADVAAIDDPTG